MTSDDVDAVLDLERRIYPQPWSRSVFMDEVGLANRNYVAAVDTSGNVVGYGGLLLVDGDAHITTLAVDPAVRRHRLGTRLMLSLVDSALAWHASHLTLEVRMSNDGAQRLYERFGMTPVGLRKNYYRDEDALIMWAIDIDGEEYSARLANIRAALDEAND